MNLVIVESPAKAKTINKYLGPDYQVLASFGHIRDLPSKNGSVLPDEDFRMTWELDRDGNKRVNDIATALKNSDRLYLATDPDREGEAISWHVLEVLAKKKALAGKEVKRVVFNEITKSAILKAMAEPRELDQELVDAYLARRALDYLVGFTLSPVLWRKLPGARSAGRVQSVALRLVCDRELEIEKFRSEEYWTVDAMVGNSEGSNFVTRLTHLDGKKLGKFDLPTGAKATAAAEVVKAGTLTIASVEKKPAKRHPYAPFTTSTLQQEAARKLGFSARQTMQVAQKLYEGKSINGEVTGLITYMRTDGVSIAGEAIAACRSVVADSYGDRYVPAKPRAYSSKAKNAQEAHEAIRPTDLRRKVSHIASALNDDERRLYDLIWKRTLASQMASAEMERTTVNVDVSGGKAAMRATGTVVQFDGFLKLYEEGRDDRNDNGDDKRLPKVREGEPLIASNVTADQHFTEPPPRYSEASLVKKLEELGIGRPSTYASTLSVLGDRNYVHIEKKRFIPEDKGRLVTAFLEIFFEQYVEYDFTARLEKRLDDISAGKLDWRKVLEDFWQDFHPKTEEILQVRNAEVIDAIDEFLAPHVFPQVEGGPDVRKCPTCEDGRLNLKAGKFGAFVGCSNYPECNYTRPLTQSNGETAQTENAGPQILGDDPETGLPISVRDGRFGPYIQLGEANKETKEKPKRASIPKDVTPDMVTFEKAIALLSLPRHVGEHPESGKPITAAIGRYGPYVLHDGVYANMPTSDEVFTVGLNRAVSLIAEAATKKKGGNFSALKDLGAHPEDGDPVKVMNGRYGPYVKHKRINATIPKGTDPETITMEAAVELLAAKAAKKGGKKPAKKKAPKKPAKKKTAKAKSG